MACFIAGTLALGSLNGLPANHLKLAKDIAKGCRKMYETKTGLGPEIVYFNIGEGNMQDILIKVRSIDCVDSLTACCFTDCISGEKTWMKN